MRTTYNIFNDILGLRNIIDDYFEVNNDRFNRSCEMPFVNIYAKDDLLTAKFLVPGIRQEDISIQMIDSNLHISAKRTRDDEGKNFTRRERNFGTFSKAVKIPFKVNTDSISAKLKDGILTVTLEKAEEAKPKKIEIR